MPGILSKINDPSDIRALDRLELPGLCEEARSFLIDTILKQGGHFSGNLGVVELTVALHHLLNLPDDVLIWDVGHQAYLHKLFTGRRDRFQTIRRFDGLSGFPKMSESPYDAFGTGHSSTSISACLGMAEADLLKGNDNRHVAVIGDGSLTGGMAWEALNNAGVSKARITMVINDNQIGIDPNTGAIGRMLNGLETGKANAFTALGLKYFGPVDGHNLEELLPVLEKGLDCNIPSVVHIKTIKGKGYSEAESEQTKWHAVKYVKVGEEPVSDKYNGPKYQDVFGKMLCELAADDPLIVGITPAMPSGSSMDVMMKRFPHRVFDVGIAEQHAVTFSAGLAAKGMKPFCNIYSTFLQRGYDQLIHDVGLQKLPVRLFLDRAGVVGEDGPTHHGLYDLTYLRTVTGLVIAAPMNGDELQSLMHLAARFNEGPIAIRYPRGRAPQLTGNYSTDLEPGKGRWLTRGGDVALLTIGHIGNQGADAVVLLKSSGIEAAHTDMRFVYPMDTDILKEVFANFKHIYTAEDGIVEGGFGSAVNDQAIRMGYKGQIVNLGFPNECIGQDTREGQYERYGLDARGIAGRILRDLNS